MTTTQLSWSELQTVLTETPVQTFSSWYTTGRLQRDLPEIYALYGVPQKAEHHPEIDTGVHTMLVIEQAQKLSKDPAVLFAALVHDLGKALTPPDEWPAHRGHEERGMAPVNALCDRLAVPVAVRTLALQVCEEHLICHRAFEMRPGSLVQWLEKAGWLADRQGLTNFIAACEADARGRTGFENREYLSGYYLNTIADIAAPLLLSDEKTRDLRLQAAISAVKHHFHPFHNLELRKDVVRKGANLDTSGISTDNPVC